MLLSELSQWPVDAPNPDVAGITADSRAVKPGFLFAALPGTAVDGAKFVPEASQAGAVAVLAGRNSDVSGFDGPVLWVDDPRRELSLMAARFYPRQPKTMAAVTGTAGKTSVASFLRQIWENTGERAAMIGTTGVFAPGRSGYGALTTPDPVRLHELLDELAGDDVTHCSMEASSHGLDQRRLDGVRLSVAGFTNLGHDHLDYHPTVEDYLAAKLRLFDTLMPKGQPAVIYADDRFSQDVIDAAEGAQLLVCTVGRAGTFLALKRIEQHRHAQIAEVEHEGSLHRIELPMAGEFQLANALVAAGMAIATGSEANAVFRALEDLKGAPGRLELVGTTGDGAPVYVDYAHKPDALENVLQALRPYTTGRLIVVFGCGGDRDRAKRPMMGEIASRLADIAVVTDDNPRTEDGAGIRAQIMQAAPGAVEIGERGEAIREAVGMLTAGDTLVVAGKGHEEGQIVGETVLPFSDHEQVRQALRERT